MITNSKIKGKEIFNELCKIITAPSGQDARISETDKIVAKNCAKYLIEKLREELVFSDGRNDLLINISNVIDEL